MDDLYLLINLGSSSLKKALVNFTRAFLMILLLGLELQLRSGRSGV